MVFIPISGGWTYGPPTINNCATIGRWTAYGPIYVSLFLKYGFICQHEPVKVRMSFKSEEGRSTQEKSIREADSRTRVAWGRRRTGGRGMENNKRVAELTDSPVDMQTDKSSNQTQELHP